MALENRSIGPLLEDVEAVGELTAVLYPQEIIVFDPPASQAPKELRQLEERSPLEVFLLSIQSTGTWFSFLSYAVAGAVLAWIAFYTNTVYLLIAAMLIAPFAGPAMNVALTTATGDRELFGQALLRYFVAVGATMGVAGLLSFAFRQYVVTDLMTGVGQASAAAVLLPLVAGAAGAINLIQSERSSLVSGTAVGMLVTASLAPPAALIGMAGVMGEWSLVGNAIFQLVLQLVGINLAGSIVFHWQGLVPSLRRYDRGKERFFYVSLVLTIVALAALLFWQFSDPLRLERSSENTRAARVVRSVIDGSGLARAVNVNTSFQSTQAYGQNSLLVTVYVERSEVPLTNTQIGERLQRKIQAALQDTTPQIVPLVDVIVLDPPAGTPASRAVER